jgi:hypothetical protein
LNLPQNWGTLPEERSLRFSCDRILTRPDAALYRGLTIGASPQIVFRWLCQMRVAPYSYDWLDNNGRQSPRELVPGLENLAVGQDVMRIFSLIDFIPNQELTIRVKAGANAFRVFGDVVCSYLVVAKSENTSRLLVKLIARYPPGARGWFIGTFLPWGDLIMMRRQLLNLKQLAEALPTDTQEIP